MRKVAENIWVEEKIIKVVGVHLPARMTAIKLSDGGLLLYSPFAPTDERDAFLADLGPVRYAVAPNKFHHLYIGHYTEKYPDAQVLGAPGLGKKREDVAFEAALSADPVPGWAADLDQHLIGGYPAVGETVLFHRASRTLIAADTLFNLARSTHTITRIYQMVALSGDGPAVSKLLKWVLKDKAAARASIDHILGWDFDRLIMCHGEIIETGGREILRKAFDWL